MFTACNTSGAEMLSAVRGNLLLAILQCNNRHIDISCMSCMTEHLPDQAQKTGAIVKWAAHAKAATHARVSAYMQRNMHMHMPWQGYMPWF